MNWLDVCGPPGVGKSTICDPLWHSQLRFDDGRLPPASWQPWLDEVTRLFGLIRPHPTFQAAIRMNRRSMRKMATVARTPEPLPSIVCPPGIKPSMEPGGTTVIPWGELRTIPGLPYIQTGLVQRGLGFGWRLNQMGADVGEIREYFRLMPVSLGVAVLTAPTDVIEVRNRARLDNPETAHEDRAFMVPLMQKPLEVAIDTLRGRGVPILAIDTTWPVETCRSALVEFAAAGAAQSDPPRYSGEDTVLHAPPWWG